MLDTDVLIEILRKRDPALRERVMTSGRLCFSSISLSELRYGAARSTDPASSHAGVDELGLIASVVDFDAEAAHHAGDVRARLVEVGLPIGAYDALIAGHALALGLPLATRNSREFSRVPGLALESW